jgi:hypothetical protein
MSRELRRRLTLFWIIVAVLILLGCLASAAFSDGHWIERTGKLVVAASLGMTYLQFQFESERHRHVDSRIADTESSLTTSGVPRQHREELLEATASDVAESYERSRRQILLNAIAAAALGECLAALGSPAFALVSRALIQ